MHSEIGVNKMKKKNLILELLKIIGVTAAGWILWVFIFSAISQAGAEGDIEPFKGASMIFGFITAITVLFILEINSINLLKQQVLQTLNNITITNKRADSLLDKANRVAKKYMKFESETVSEIASAIKPKKSPSKSIKNSSSFEQRINEFPQLKSDQAVMELLRQLRESENIIANFKLEHNDFVSQYNYNINSFPIIIFKGAFKINEFSFYSDDKDMISDEELGI